MSGESPLARGPAAGAILLAALLTAAVAAADTRPVRIIDEAIRHGATEEGRLIDGVWRRVPTIDPLRFSLHATPDAPRLRFAIGLQPNLPSGRVRFEVLLERADAPPVAVYSRELTEPGWVEAEVDLRPYDLSGTRLLFRKTLVEGPMARGIGAHFAEPMLVSGRPPRMPSVVLISLDTLRADRVGVAGHAAARTPTLDRLAADGVWYANAYSASNWTYPSHASLLYGLYPASLPLVGTPGSPPAPPGGGPPTLGELFRQGGYLTAGFTGGGFLAAVWGFHRGFDTYFEFPQPKGGADGCRPERFDGAEVFARAARWVRAHADRPFFLFVHTYDAHDRCEVWPAGLRPMGPWPDPGPSTRATVSRYYDDRIAAVDGLVGGLVRELDALRLSERVVVAVTSDHGEALWEHGFFGHGCALRPVEPLVRVPLIVRAPGHDDRRGRVEQPVAAVDVAPTLLALAGLPRPAGLQGQVLPGLGGDARPASAPIFVHCEDNLAVRVGDHKLIAKRGRAAEDAVYDLARDPAERHDVLGSAGPEAALLRRHAAEYWARGAAGAGAVREQLKALDEQTRERLRALGYVQ